MPSIKDQSTVDKIAQVFCGEGERNKAKTLRIIGYAENYCNNNGTGVVYTNDRVIAAIARIDKETRAESVADRRTRQQFWTDMMQDKQANSGDRLRASELLGRSEADFTDNINDSREGLTIQVNTDKGPKLSKEA